jgi:hypothetical protein
MKLKLFIFSLIVYGGVTVFTPTYVYAQARCVDQSGATVPLTAAGCPPGSAPVGSNGYQGVGVNGNLTYTPLEPISSTPNSAPSSFCGLVNLLFKALIYIGGMIAVLFLVLGGITYMVSEVVDKRTVARNRIKSALWGLAILLISWIILNTINPQLVSACNSLAPANAAGIFDQKQPVQNSFLPTQVVINPNAPIPNSNNNTIEDLVGKPVIKRADGTVLSLTINTANPPGSPIPQVIAEFRSNCEGANGAMNPIPGFKLGQSPSVTVYVCTQK